MKVALRKSDSGHESMRIRRDLLYEYVDGSAFFIDSVVRVMITLIDLGHNFERHNILVH
jgi:hypothetical protein